MIEQKISFRGVGPDRAHFQMTCDISKKNRSIPYSSAAAERIERHLNFVRTRAPSAVGTNPVRSQEDAFLPEPNGTSYFLCPRGPPALLDFLMVKLLIGGAILYNKSARISWNIPGYVTQLSAISSV